MISRTQESVEEDKMAEKQEYFSGAPNFSILESVIGLELRAAPDRCRKFVIISMFSIS